MARIVSPMHRLACAALLPGVTYKREQGFNGDSRPGPDLQPDGNAIGLWLRHCLSNLKVTFSDLCHTGLIDSTHKRRRSQELLNQRLRLTGSWRPNTFITKIKTVSGTEQEFLVVFPWLVGGCRGSDWTTVATVTRKLCCHIKLLQFKASQRRQQTTDFIRFQTKCTFMDEFLVVITDA